MTHWKANRDGDWWYDAPWGKATASASPTFATIESIETEDGKLTETRLHEVIASAWLEVGDGAMRCYLSRTTRPLLERLREQGLVDWETAQNPYSEDARILRVMPVPGSKSSPHRTG